MKSALILLLLLTAVPAEEPASPFRDLADQMVTALRTGDSVQYAQCWLSHRQLVAMAKTANPPLPAAAMEELALMRTYLEERNRHVAHSFAVLRDALARLGDPATLTVVSAEGRISERGGIRKSSMVDIRVALGGRQATISIDDANEVGGLWYFTDKPLYLREEATDLHVGLTLPDGAGASAAPR